MGTLIKHSAMIAGTHSGAGKTTFTLALGALARLKGLEVQPFKAGPDYIDTAFHGQISGRPSRNLDLFLLSEETVRRTFFRASAGVDIALLEGVMGLFDGQDFKGKASSAEIAKLLGVPVFLVVDGSGMAASAAATVLGFQKLDPQVKLAGVFFNRVNSEGHYQYLKQAVEARTSVPCLGYLPFDAEISIPERHLGLKTAVEIPDLKKNIAKMADLLETRIDWHRFWALSGVSFTNSDAALIAEKPVSSAPYSFARPFKIAVARDEAFSFYYEDNLDLLKEAGARLAFFSPLRDTELPQADLLYIGGGFPELYVESLAANIPMLSEIRNFYNAGGWIYAECGGLMYLSKAFCDASGRELPMLGLMPGKTRMAKTLQHFGYHEMTAAKDHFFFQEGEKVSAHEFHYSVWDEEGKHAPAYMMGERQEGYTAPRLVATYQHLHFGSVPGLAGSLIHHIVKERNFVC